MCRLFVFLCALIASAANAARPMIIHESQILDPPATLDHNVFAPTVAVDGDWAIVTAGKQTLPYGYPTDNYALLYRRAGASWVFDRILLHTRSETDFNGATLSVAMGNGLAALQLGPLAVFQRAGTAWTQLPSPFTAVYPDPAAATGQVAWSGTTLLAAQPCHSSNSDWGALVATRLANGSWSSPERISSGDFYCAEEPMAVDISGPTATIATYSNDYEAGPDEMHVYRRVSTGWRETFAFPWTDAQGAVRGSAVFRPTRTTDGIAIYSNNDPETVLDRARTISAAHPEPRNGQPLVHSGDILLEGDTVFVKTAAGNYEHVARLVPSADSGLAGRMAVSGRRILVPGYRHRTSLYPIVLAFDLPTTFTPSKFQQFTFESGNAAGWTPAPGSQFSVTAGAGNRVYRQSSLSGDSLAILDNSDWVDQSIEAVITPRAFAGADNWVGLAVRRSDASNFYYLTLRQSGWIYLKRMQNGVATIIGQREMAITAGKPYHVSLSALSDMIRVSIDGKALFAAPDTALTHGSAALIGYRSQADYDNVLVGELGPTAVYEQQYGCQASPQTNWTLAGGEWTCPDRGLMNQTSTAGDARAAVGVPTDDLIVRTRVRATAFAAPAGNQARWVGIATRYRDVANYYYLSLRNSNTVSLRRVVNGSITELGSVALPVSIGSWYELRLDAVGDQLRAFVNGAQVLQSTDATFATGQAGLLTYKAAAEYEGFRSYQP